MAASNDPSRQSPQPPASRLVACTLYHRCCSCDQPASILDPAKKQVATRHVLGLGSTNEAVFHQGNFSCIGHSLVGPDHGMGRVDTVEANVRSAASAWAPRNLQWLKPKLLVRPEQRFWLGWSSFGVWPAHPRARPGIPLPDCHYKHTVQLGSKFQPDPTSGYRDPNLLGGLGGFFSNLTL
jgi:hypothetical protein